MAVRDKETRQLIDHSSPWNRFTNLLEEHPRRAIATGVIGGVVVGFVSGLVATPSKAPKPSAPTVGQSRDHISPEAAAVAAHYTQELNALKSNNTVADIKFAQGTVYETAANGTKQRLYGDPIILTTKQGTGQVVPDAAGMFLQGSTIGIESVGPKGTLVIQAVPYEKGYTFKALDQNRVVVSDPAYLGGGLNGPEVFLMDPQTNTTLVNPDGSPVLPGIFEGK